MSDDKSSGTHTAVPEGLIVYAIGDIHGRLDLLDALLEQIGHDISQRRQAKEQVLLITLGDYVDRGPDTPGVLERLRTLSLENGQTRCLLGNHEDSLLSFLEHPADGLNWLKYGGLETLRSYGVDTPDKEPEALDRFKLSRAFRAVFPGEHRQFLQNMPLWTTCGDYLFVHAGIRPGISLGRQSRRDMLWIREPFLSCTDTREHTVVHGHTIHPTPENRANRIGIDTGAWRSNVLTAVVLHGTQRSFIQTH
ncbi:serine/threonine protein phosphatase [Haematospirillum jordaniae]|uniref:Calcineurin-like phosphoesterase domain-containing protein n=1 Tax=Haematospirillum jordaniae TaxID=1549855 RepID=A0A143DD24_9PROT|nr:metallophosphoesterase family protein [Haematospirillum jordaniae]AMW34173.1 hypothetical protein AY555_02120 [Haematospirillum jordaniae]NKD45858.1 serine/threonine protein phosphatase [Haematospirillum jordaniae]NKD57175.1 serine/threonine protein phosphatase [Haematospirillum jordaniae]NKD59408.1 serine/threonine protein phosphatase [Haematospirillum jordaniae]NKD67101.1 serine/threonine protein phosphatase [Haematospirillum jordaniae]